MQKDIYKSLIIEQKKLLDVRVDFGINKEALISWIKDRIQSHKKGTLSYICTTNPEFIMLAQNDSKFKNIINNSTLSLPDGFGTILAYEYIKSIEKVNLSLFYSLILFCKGFILGIKSFFYSFPSEAYLLPGSKLVYSLCELASKNNYSVFLLGGRPKDFLGRMKKVDYDLATDAAKILKKTYPKLKIIGASSAFSGHKSDDDKTVAYIKSRMQESNCSSIDILFVAYGAPAQEKWIVRNSNKLDAKLSIGVGGSFNYISGDVLQPGTFITRLHLEWLYRLLLHPWRLKRILIAFPIFPLKLYLYYIKKHKSY